MEFHLSEATNALREMVGSFVERLPYIALAVLVFIAFVFLARGVRIGARRFVERRQRRVNLGIVLGRLAYGSILFIGLLIALVIAVPGFTPGQLISVLGLSSVAIGFAFRDILQNFLAGILILLSEPFRIGDQIVLGEFEGTVEEIQMRATFITTYDGRRIVIPNSNLFTNSVTVNTAHASRRLEYDVGIGYGDDISRAKEILLQAVAGTPGALSEPAPDVLIVALAESSIRIRLRWWVKPPRQFDILQAQDAVLHKAVDGLREAGIDLPFPTHQILFHDQTEETDGDRRRQREGWPAGPDGVPQPRRMANPSADLGARRQEGMA